MAIRALPPRTRWVATQINRDFHGLATAGLEEPGRARAPAACRSGPPQHSSVPPLGPPGADQEVVRAAPLRAGLADQDRLASSASNTGTRSAAGDALTMLPPTVAMLRTCRPPITADACASATRFVWKPGWLTTASCVAMAPIAYSVAVSPIVSRPSPRQADQVLRRRAAPVDLDDEDPPPARKRAASPCSRAKAMAASRLWPVKREAHRRPQGEIGWERGSPEPLMGCGSRGKSGSGEPRSQQADRG